MQDETLTPAAAPASDEKAGHPGPLPPEAGPVPSPDVLEQLNVLGRLDAIVTAHAAIGGQLADIKTELADLKAQLSGVGDGIAAELDELRTTIEEGAAMAAKKQDDKPKKPAPAKKDTPADKPQDNGGAGDTGDTGEHGERGTHE